MAGRWQVSGKCFFSGVGERLDPQAGRRILAKDLAGPDIAPQCRNGLVPRLTHDDELADAVHGRLGDAACPERMPGELLDLQSRPACCTLQQLADGILVQASPRYMTVAADRPEDGTVGNSGSGEPLPE